MSEQQETGEELRPPSRRADDRELRRQLRHESRTQQTYRAFLRRLCANGKLPEDMAERAAVVVLGHLERRLMGDEALDMEAQLPQKLQSLLYQSGTRGLGPEKFSRAEFVRRVADDLGMSESEAEPVIRSVLITVGEQISEGEMEDILHQLPLEFSDLFRRGA